ncbi:hypothetical protein [Coraliomargarita parva]|uniref:hypothetical protein n=1 Tax=Coraliomargarita parva TaxID=3014050 RepID=UPI0022B4A707|nr:hypothetical protein [Coraliomargarita parva]
MKHSKKLILLPALCLALGTGRASAGDDEAVAAIGGFIGGIIATKVFDHHKDHHRSHEVVIIETNSCCGGHGYHEKSCNKGRDKYFRHGHKKHDCDRRCPEYGPSGYYKVVTVKVWIPGCWTYERDRCGNRIKRWEPGYYEYEKKRVWVSHGSDRHDRHEQYAYDGRH